MATTRSDLTLEQFFALPEGETAFELVDGQAVAKVSSKFFHASLQKVLLRLLDGWAMDHGRLGPKWAVVLKRRGVDWVPVPGLTYFSPTRKTVYQDAKPMAEPMTLGLNLSALQIFDQVREVRRGGSNRQ
ncbi:Uma2 family endonuclease [Gloeobacter morelensis]|uniref:Uma2 family endonuclease n=1 Tax=Gloeobacter morelensis MG652769 TaxID=2781736 RepID=A0ABY3PQY8_9CYAN|nr:Uma2 family endonuclease [Gloeobacter morelensis]UFP95939.1 Uma2 family endonuclease [Gloeobacter morelensis MG652769]